MDGEESNKERLSERETKKGGGPGRWERKRKSRGKVIGCEGHSNTYYC